MKDNDLPGHIDHLTLLNENSTVLVITMKLEEKNKRSRPQEVTQVMNLIFYYTEGRNSFSFHSLVAEGTATLFF